MSVFLDANVLLEVLIPGRPGKTRAYAQMQKEAVVSPLSAHLYVYFGQKEGFPLEILKDNLLLLSFTSYGVDEIRWAISNCQGEDFEDALQVACALLHNCQEFVTFDKALAKKYQRFIPVRQL